MGRMYRGVIVYRHEDVGITGRENFNVTVHDDGSRTIRCVCEMDDVPLVRDVVYTVNERFEAMDSFVRVQTGRELIGTGWFHFTDSTAEGESFTALEGRVSQRIATPGRVKLFGSHPISLDILKCAHAAPERVGEVQTLRNCFSSTPAPNGAGGPTLNAKTYDLTFRGHSTVTTPAGPFNCLNFTWDTHTGRTLSLHTVPGDWLPVRVTLPETGRIYELVEFETLRPAAETLRDMKGVR